MNALLLPLLSGPINVLLWILVVLVIVAVIFAILRRRP
jgi:hypothetical protein